MLLSFILNYIYIMFNLVKISVTKFTLNLKDKNDS